MPDLTPLEAAEKLEEILYILQEVLRKDHENAIQSAASYLRKIAAGKYKQVVHAHWDGGYYSKNGQWYFAEVKCSGCHKTSYGGKTPYCPSCGSRMDGKDGKS